MEQIFTVKDAPLCRRPVFEAERMPGAVLLEAGAPRTGFSGCGVALTGSSCYLLSKMPPEKRRAIIEDLYASDGLSLSCARLTMGSSDYSAELYSYDDGGEDTPLLRFSVEKDEAYIIPVIKEILSVRPDLYVFASPWSPPGWMKTCGALCGGYMREKYVDCYADYFVKYIEAYAARGIKISAVTPQNEPETQQRGLMPACLWHPETEAKFILALRKKLDAAGLDTGIWMHDHNFSGAGRVMWELDNTPGLRESVSGVAFHYYEGSFEHTLLLREKYPGLPFYFTEGGPRLFENYGSDHCKWGRILVGALRGGFDCFCGWNLVLDEEGFPNIGPFRCGGLITENSADGALSYSGQYRAFQLFSPRIRRESAVYPLAPAAYGRDNGKNAAPGVCGVTAETDGRQTALLVNSAAEKRQVQLYLDGRLIYAELPPDSVSVVGGQL